MSLDFIRDIIIVISGVIFFILLFFAGVMLVSFYRQLSPVLDSVQTVTEVMYALSSAANGFLEPMVRMFTFFRNIRQGFRFGEREGGEDGQR